MQRIAEQPQFRGRAVAQALGSGSYRRVFDALNHLEALEPDDIARNAQEVKLFFENSGFQKLVDFMRPDPLSLLRDLPSDRPKSVSQRRREKQKAKKGKGGASSGDEDAFPDRSMLDPGPQYSVPIPINGQQIKLPLGVYLRIQSCSLLSRFAEVPAAAEAILTTPIPFAPTATRAPAAANNTAAAGAAGGESKEQQEEAKVNGAAKPVLACERVLQMLMRGGVKINKNIKVEVALDKIAAVMAMPVLVGTPKGVEWLMSQLQEVNWLDALVETLNGLLRVPMLATCPAQHDGLAGGFATLYLALTPFASALGLPGALERGVVELSQAAQKTQKECVLALIKSNFFESIVMPCLNFLAGLIKERRFDNQTLVALRSAMLCTLGFVEALRYFDLTEYLPARIRKILSGASSSAGAAAAGSDSGAAAVTSAMAQMSLDAGKENEKDGQQQKEQQQQQQDENTFAGSRRAWWFVCNNLAIVSQMLNGAFDMLVQELLLYTTGVGPEQILYPKCGSPLCFKRDTKDTFAKCGRCHKVAYCSKECQRLDWAGHKQFCAAKAAAASASAAPATTAAPATQTA